MTLRRGDRLALLGANGAGKSTLLLHLNGSLRPRSGELRFQGAAFAYDRAALRALRSHIALVFQEPDEQLFASTVEEDVAFGPANQGLASALCRQRVKEALSTVGLLDLASRPPHSLSRGQKLRVALAGALAMQPSILVLDEPSAGMDARGLDQLLGLLERLQKSDVTVVIASHDLAFLRSWATSAVLLDEGRVVADGSWSAVLSSAAFGRLAGTSRRCAVCPISRTALA